MRAAFLHRVGDLRLGELPHPLPAEDEILLKVLAVGLCGSDLHFYLEGGSEAFPLPVPLVLGHEIAAEVADERAESFGLTRGQLVAVDPAQPCGECEWCGRGQVNLCPHQYFVGSPPDRHGGLREYITAPRQNLFPVPASFSTATVALLELLGVAIHTVRLAALQGGETIVVLGAGPLGLLLLQVARDAGADRILVIDPLEYRADFALSLGADGSGTDVDIVQELTEGRGADVVLEATDSPHGPAAAAEAGRIGGRLILAGIPAGDRFSLSAAVLRRKGMTIKLVRRMAHVYPQAIQLVEEGKVDLSPLATHRFPLEQTAEAFALQAERRDGVIKCVIEV